MKFLQVGKSGAGCCWSSKSISPLINVIKKMIFNFGVTNFLMTFNQQRWPNVPNFMFLLPVVSEELKQADTRALANTDEIALDSIDSL